VNLVLDASVVLKWFFNHRPAETDSAAALALLKAVGDGTVSLYQPPHFVAEVAAVLAREMPDQARARLADLQDIEMRCVDDPHVMARAVSLATRYKHHVFDTLYHAVALETPDALLVTADEVYLRKASGQGRIVGLAAFSWPA
jgi:predicted nucleic acid-binding protein